MTHEGKMIHEEILSALGYSDRDVPYEGGLRLRIHRAARGVCEGKQDVFVPNGREPLSEEAVQYLREVYEAGFGDFALPADFHNSPLHRMFQEQSECASDPQPARPLKARDAKVAAKGESVRRQSQQAVINQDAQAFSDQIDDINTHSGDDVCASDDGEHVVEPAADTGASEAALACVSSVENMAYRPHPVSEIFPSMDDQQFACLKADIKANGQREPIVVYQGQIIDGLNRYRACNELNILPKVREWDGTGSLLDFALSANLTRRHLTESQRAMAAAKALPFFEDAAKERQRQAGRTHGRGKVGADLRGSNGKGGKATKLAAERFNTSARLVEYGKSVLRHGTTELIELVNAGKLKATTAALVANLEPQKQRKIVQLGREKMLCAISELKSATKSHRKKEKPILDPGETTTSHSTPQSHERTVSDLFQQVRDEYKRAGDSLVEFIQIAADQGWHSYNPVQEHKLRLLEQHAENMQRLLAEMEEAASEIAVSSEDEQGSDDPDIDTGVINVTVNDVSIEEIASALNESVPENDEQLKNLLEKAARLPKVPATWKQLSPMAKKLIKKKKLS